MENKMYSIDKANEGKAFNIMAYVKSIMEQNDMGSDVASYLKRARSSNYDNLVIVSKEMCDKINSSFLKRTHCQKYTFFAS